MALIKASLKARIIAELTAQGFDVSGGGFAKTVEFAEALANAIIDEITINGLVVGVDTPTGDSHSLNIT